MSTEKALPKLWSLRWGITVLDNDGWSDKSFKSRK